MRPKTRDNSKIPIQVKPCKSCPFEGEEPIDLTPDARARYFARITNLEGVHLCHSVNNEMICRGGQNLMLKVMYAKKLIDSPTDEAFIRARQAHLGF